MTIKHPPKVTFKRYYSEVAVDRAAEKLNREPWRNPYEYLPVKTVMPDVGATWFIAAYVRKAGAFAGFVA